MKFDYILILTMLFSLSMTSFLQSQDDVVYMKITGKSGKQVTANKGREAGIQAEWVYDLKRIVKLDTIQLGIAIVQQVEAQTCLLTPFGIQTYQTQPNDVLIKNEELTQTLARTQSSEFWNEVQARHSGADPLDFVDGQRFEHCKIALKAGENLTPKYIIVKRDVGVIIPKRYHPEGELIPLENIERIQTATGDYALAGALTGAAMSGGMIWLINKARAETDTIFYYTYNRDVYGKATNLERKWRIQKTEHRLSKNMQILGVIGGYLIGSFVGRSFKGLWQEIYHSEKVPENFSLKWDISQPLPDAIGVNLKIQF